MAWIESHQGLAKHPKTKKLMRRLDVTGPVIVGHLHYLWWWALDFAQDGEITQYDAFDIADACEWTGDANTFYTALIESGFIDIEEDRKFIHDWYDYAGKLIEIRKKDAERKRKSRGKNKESEGSPADVQGTSEGRRTESIRDPNHNQDLNQEIKSSSGENPYRLFQNEIGVVSGTMSQMLQELVAEHGERQVCEAIREAIRQGKRKLSYIEGILKRWKTDGNERPKLSVFPDLPTIAEVRAEEERKKKERQEKLRREMFGDVIDGAG